MKKRSQKMAYCSMTTALGVTLMMILGFTGIGTYAAPMLATMMLVSVQRKFGTGQAVTVWLATGLLSLILVTDKEQSLVYLMIYGWYPILRPTLERIPNPLRLPVKLLCFNGAAVLSYSIMIPLLGLTAEMTGPVMLGLMLFMGNFSFLMIDLFIIPAAIPVFEEHYGKKFRM